MQIIKPAPDHISLLLTEEEGTELRELIAVNINTSFAYYITNVVGMHYSNVHAYLTGKKAITLRNLIKLLSGTKIEVEECITLLTLVKKDGEDVQSATFIGLDDLLSSPELEELDTQLDEDTQESSSLEKPPERRKTALERLSSVNQDDSST